MVFERREKKKLVFSTSVQAYNRQVQALNEELISQNSNLAAI
jgi:hypothetical protein